MPWAHTGSEAALPPDTFRVQPADIHITFGNPIRMSDLNAAVKGEKRNERVMDALGFVIANLLPPERRGDYACVRGREEAARLAAELASP